MRDLKHNIKVFHSIAPQIIGDATPVVGAVVDRSGYESVTYVINGGAMSLGTGEDVTPLLEESDEADFSPSNPVADEDLIGTEVAATYFDGDDNTVRTIGYVGNRRYTRLTLTGSDNAITSAPLSAIAILGHAHDRPVA